LSLNSSPDGEEEYDLIFERHLRGGRGSNELIHSSPDKKIAFPGRQSLPDETTEAEEEEDKGDRNEIILERTV